MSLMNTIGMKQVLYVSTDNAACKIVIGRDSTFMVHLTTEPLPENIAYNHEPHARC